MRARIYKPAKTAMSSGTAKTRGWVLEYVAETARSVDPLMGWTSSTDTQAQVTAKGIDVSVQEPKERKPVIRPGGYGENFATNRRGAWTH